MQITREWVVQDFCTKAENCVELKRFVIKMFIKKNYDLYYTTASVVVYVMWSTMHTNVIARTAKFFDLLHYTGAIERKFRAYGEPLLGF